MSKKEATARRLAGPNDILIPRPFNQRQISEELSKLRAELDRRPIYEVFLQPESMQNADLVTRGVLQGISETGACVRCNINSSTPTDKIEIKTDFFDKHDIPEPTLHLVESHPDASDLGFKCRAVFQIKRWTDKDRQAVRKFSTRKGIVQIR